MAVVDDVISTGESLQAIERLVEKAGGEVAARAAILAEGDARGAAILFFWKSSPFVPHRGLSEGGGQRPACF